VPPNFQLHRRRLVLFILLGSLALGVLTGQVRSADRRGIGRMGVVVEGALAPAARGLSRMSEALAHSWSLLREIGTLRQENARLAAEVARLRQENAQLRGAAQESAQLRALLAFKREHTYRSVSARVIGRDPSHWFSTVLVDRGAADGVQRNDPVVTSDGLVGHVIETGGTWARVLLILDPRSAVGVAVERSREAGVTQGQGTAVVRVKYLSRDADVQPGDQVISSGLGQIYPRGLPVGTVTRVNRPTGQTLFQEALVKPAAGLNHLEDVLILLRSAVEVAR
jgi:rod shape-determining protein MreC